MTQFSCQAVPASWRRLLIAGFALAALPSSAQAEDWKPSAPIHMIVPYAPGGGADSIARQLTQPLGEALGQSVIVDNRGGGGGVIGMNALANAKPDGYTICLIATGAHASNATLMKVPYDSVEDFQWLSLVGTSPEVLVLAPINPANTVKELLDNARQAGKPLAFASGGIGLGSHIAGELLKYRTGAAMTHVPFKGGGPAMVAVMGGQTDMLFDPLGAVISLTQSGKLKAIAITSKTRAAQLPNVPTMDENGFPDFYFLESYAILGPKGMPADAVASWHDAIVKVLKEPKVIDQFKTQGITVQSSTPQELHDNIAAQVTMYREIIQHADIKLNQ